MRLLNKFVLIGLLFTSYPALAAKYCSTEQPTYNVDLQEINIDPGANVGDVVAQSGDISKSITCSGSPTASFATLLAQRNQLTDVYITIPGRTIIAEQGGRCRVMESGYPGLGIAWYNYNSGTGRWHCFSNNELQGRALAPNGARDIMDVIYLVKTGDIETGDFYFNKKFSIDETASSNLSLNYGEIYSITLSGQTKISAPVCEATAEKGTGRYPFSIDDALNQSYSTEDRQINVSCEGYIANGTTVSFKIESSNGLFSLDSSYFATSDAGLGVLVKYKTESDSRDQTLQPTGRISIPINNNKGSFGLKFIPYVKSGSGVYPLSINNDFNIEVTASN